MPSVDFRCRHCHQRFTRVVLRGEETVGVPCPECGRRAPPEGLPGKSLFEGIAGFSALSKDTN